MSASHWKAVVWRLLPPAVQERYLKAKIERTKRRLFGHLAPLVPPESLMHDGPPTYEEFHANGQEFLRIHKELCGLRPDEAVLDVGCGIGRKTIFLTDHLGPRGRYEGTDVVKSGIDWCAEKITSAFPNFRFSHIDVYNKWYNPTATRRAHEYRFTFPDATFDLLTMGSVFTHMLRDDLENYLRESARVLKPGGRALISWFILNDESRALVSAGRSTLPFTHQVDAVSWSINSENPENAVAYEEAFVRDLYAQTGFAIQGPIHFGSWCGRGRFLSYQDLVLAVRE